MAIGQGLWLFLHGCPFRAKLIVVQAYLERFPGKRIWWTTATSVQVQDGEILTTDGPFAETKEVLGGFHMIDVPDLDAARMWAAKIPSAPFGTVEIGPIMEVSDA